MNLSLSSHGEDSSPPSLEDVQSLEHELNFADVLRRMPRLLMSDLTLVPAAQHICERIVASDDKETTKSGLRVLSLWGAPHPALFSAVISLLPRLSDPRAALECLPSVSTGSPSEALEAVHSLGAALAADASLLAPVLGTLSQLRLHSCSSIVRALVLQSLPRSADEDVPAVVRAVVRCALSPPSSIVGGVSGPVLPPSTQSTQAMQETSSAADAEAAELLLQRLRLLPSGSLALSLAVISDEGQRDARVLALLLKAVAASLETHGADFSFRTRPESDSDDNATADGFADNSHEGLFSNVDVSILLMLLGDPSHARAAFRVTLLALRLRVLVLPAITAALDGMPFPDSGCQASQVSERTLLSPVLEAGAVALVLRLVAAAGAHTAAMWALTAAAVPGSGMARRSGGIVIAPFPGVAVDDVSAGLLPRAALDVEKEDAALHDSESRRGLPQWLTAPAVFPPQPLVRVTLFHAAVSQTMRGMPVAPESLLSPLAPPSLHWACRLLCILAARGSGSLRALTNALGSLACGVDAPQPSFTPSSPQQFAEDHYHPTFAAQACLAQSSGATKRTTCGTKQDCAMGCFDEEWSGEAVRDKIHTCLLPDDNDVQAYDSDMSYEAHLLLSGTTSGSTTTGPNFHPVSVALSRLHSARCAAAALAVATSAAVTPSPRVAAAMTAVAEEIMSRLALAAPMSLAQEPSLLKPETNAIHERWLALQSLAASDTLDALGLAVGAGASSAVVAGHGQERAIRLHKWTSLAGVHQHHSSANLSNDATGSGRFFMPRSFSAALALARGLLISESFVRLGQSTSADFIPDTFAASEWLLRLLQTLPLRNASLPSFITLPLNFSQSEQRNPTPAHAHQMPAELLAACEGVLLLLPQVCSLLPRRILSSAGNVLAITISDTGLIGRAEGGALKLDFSVYLSCDDSSAATPAPLYVPQWDREGLHRFSLLVASLQAVSSELALGRMDRAGTSNPDGDCFSLHDAPNDPLLYSPAQVKTDVHASRTPEPSRVLWEASPLEWLSACVSFARTPFAFDGDRIAAINASRSSLTDSDAAALALPLALAATLSRACACATAARAVSAIISASWARISPHIATGASAQRCWCETTSRPQPHVARICPRVRSLGELFLHRILLIQTLTRGARDAIAAARLASNLAHPAIAAGIDLHISNTEALLPSGLQVPVFPLMLAYRAAFALLSPFASLPASPNAEGAAWRMSCIVAWLEVQDALISSIARLTSPPAPGTGAGAATCVWSADGVSISPLHPVANALGALEIPLAAARASFFALKVKGNAAAIAKNTSLSVISLAVTATAAASSVERRGASVSASSPCPAWQAPCWRAVDDALVSLFDACKAQTPVELEASKPGAEWPSLERFVLVSQPDLLALHLASPKDASFAAPAVLLPPHVIATIAEADAFDITSAALSSDVTADHCRRTMTADDSDSDSDSWDEVTCRPPSLALGAVAVGTVSMEVITRLPIAAASIQSSTLLLLNAVTSLCACHPVSGHTRGPLTPPLAAAAALAPRLRLLHSIAAAADTSCSWAPLPDHPMDRSWVTSPQLTADFAKGLESRAATAITGLALQDETNSLWPSLLGASALAPLARLGGPARGAFGSLLRRSMLLQPKYPIASEAAYVMQTLCPTSISKESHPRAPSVPQLAIDRDSALGDPNTVASRVFSRVSSLRFLAAHAASLGGDSMTSAGLLLLPPTPEPKGVAEPLGLSSAATALWHGCQLAVAEELSASVDAAASEVAGRSDGSASSWVWVDLRGLAGQSQDTPSAASLLRGLALCPARPLAGTLLRASASAGATGLSTSLGRPAVAIAAPVQAAEPDQGAELSSAALVWPLTHAFSLASPAEAFTLVSLCLTALEEAVFPSSPTVPLLPALAPPAARASVPALWRWTLVACCTLMASPPLRFNGSLSSLGDADVTLSTLDLLSSTRIFAASPALFAAGWGLSFALDGLFLLLRQFICATSGLPRSYPELPQRARPTASAGEGAIFADGHDEDSVDATLPNPVVSNSFSTSWPMLARLLELLLPVAARRVAAAIGDATAASASTPGCSVGADASLAMALLLARARALGTVAFQAASCAKEVRWQPIETKRKQNRMLIHPGVGGGLGTRVGARLRAAAEELVGTVANAVSERGDWLLKSLQQGDAERGPNTIFSSVSASLFAHVLPSDLRGRGHDSALGLRSAGSSDSDEEGEARIEAPPKRGPGRPRRAPGEGPLEQQELPLRIAVASREPGPPLLPIGRWDEAAIAKFLI